MDFTIRHIAPSDYSQLTAIFAQPSVVEHSTQAPFPSEQNWQQKLQQYQEQNLQLVAISEGSVIGYIGIFCAIRPRIKHIGEIAIVVSEEAQGKGVGKGLMHAAIDTADNWLNLVRLQLDVNTDNDRAIALYKQCGFEIEGEQRFSVFRRGLYGHSYKMARIHPNYREHKFQD